MPGISDHDMVYINSNVSAKREKPSKRIIYLWKKADFRIIRNHIRLFTDKLLKSYSLDTPVEQLLRLKSGELNTIIEKLVPSKTATTRFTQPWVNKEVKFMKKNKAEILQQDQDNSLPRGQEEA